MPKAVEILQQGLDETGVGTLVVVDANRRLAGLLTTRDLRFAGLTGTVASRSASGDAAARRSRACILFHSIWYAVRIGTRSSMSLALAMKTASFPAPS